MIKCFSGTNISKVILEVGIMAIEDNIIDQAIPKKFITKAIEGVKTL